MELLKACDDIAFGAFGFIVPKYYYLLISTRFGPEKADFGSEPGRNQVKIGSKSGPGERCLEGVGAGGVGLAEMAL